jgi:hypothetical protein
VAHLATVQLRGVRFKVSERARQRVLTQRQRNVHAYAIGTFTTATQPLHRRPFFLRRKPGSDSLCHDRCAL